MPRKSANDVYEFGPFRLEGGEFLLSRMGRPVLLKGKTFQLLLTLLRNAGHVLSKEELMGQVWPQAFVEEHNLTVHISKLRKALGCERNYVETVARHGYRFVADVTRIIDQEDGGQASEADAAHMCADREGEPVTVAVLPFKLITGDVADEYLGMGLADALITKLSTLRQIIVRPTNAVRHYGDGGNPIAAGRELEVSLVLDGSIQRVGVSIRVIVQLISVAEGTAVWAGKYDENCSDILALEDSVSEQVAASLILLQEQLLVHNLPTLPSSSPCRNQSPDKAFAYAGTALRRPLHAGSPDLRHELRGCVDEPLLQRRRS